MTQRDTNTADSQQNTNTNSSVIREGTIFGVPFISIDEPFKDSSRGSSARQPSKAVETASNAFGDWYKERASLMDRRKSGADTKEAEETVKGKWEAFVDPYIALLPESDEWDQFVETVGTEHKLEEDQLTVLLYH